MFQNRNNCLGLGRTNVYKVFPRNKSRAFFTTIFTQFCVLRSLHYIHIHIRDVILLRTDSSNRAVLNSKRNSAAFWSFNAHSTIYRYTDHDHMCAYIICCCVCEHKVETAKWNNEKVDFYWFIRSDQVAILHSSWIFCFVSNNTPNRFICLISVKYSHTLTYDAMNRPINKEIILFSVLDDLLIIW